MNDKMDLKDLFAGRRILVTGHTGFKGSWLSMWLTQLGALVTGVANDIPTDPAHFIAVDLAADLTDIRLDIRDKAALN